VDFVQLSFFTFRIHKIFKGKYWLHSKNFDFFAQSMFFTDKVIKREKKINKKTSVKRRRRRRGQFFLHAYSLDHKT
jgi:hypothetical protein